MYSRPVGSIEYVAKPSELVFYEFSKITGLKWIVFQSLAY